MTLKKFYKNKKILVVGHTGFKGSWLTSWLKILGSKVMGVSFNIPSKPSNYIASEVNKKIKSKKIDIRNQKKLERTIVQFKPDIVFHLAAQALVKKSFSETLNTWHTNLIGTINILESFRNYKKKCSVIIITSDKCYKNFEIKKGYKENDILGGIDPYSASKASAEIAINSYVRSFFSKKQNKIKIVSARAGNVIGGGDWGMDRLVPDCIKQWSKNKTVNLRNPNSTRPWQHVLEAVGGYLVLGKKLTESQNLHGHSFNFGPKNNEQKSVLNLVKEMKKNWTQARWIINSKNKKFYESSLLQLNSTKAFKILKWKSVLSFKETIEFVALWYKKYYSNSKRIPQFTKDQIKQYILLAEKKKINCLK